MLCHGMTAIVIHFVRLQDLEAPFFSPHNAALFQTRFKDILALQDSVPSGEGTIDGDDMVDGDDLVNDIEEEVAEDLGKDLEGLQDLADGNGDIQVDQLAKCERQ